METDAIHWSSGQPITDKKIQHLFCTPGSLIVLKLACRLLCSMTKRKCEASGGDPALLTCCVMKPEQSGLVFAASFRGIFSSKHDSFMLFEALCVS